MLCGSYFEKACRYRQGNPKTYCLKRKQNHLFANVPVLSVSCSCSDNISLCDQYIAGLKLKEPVDQDTRARYEPHKGARDFTATVAVESQNKSL